MEQIPKVIHYCWFGGKAKPALADKCIESWKKYCPGYEIKEWNENNFDIHANAYARDAYENKKFAFVSDYARLAIIEREGGIYFDVDVELIKSIDAIIARGSFMGCEEDGGKGIQVNPGLGVAAPPHMPLMKELVDIYEQLEYGVGEDGKMITIVEHTTELLKRHGLKEVLGIQTIEGMSIYPREYFSPQHYRTGKMTITANTHSIHHYAASWFTPYQKFVYRLSHIIGEGATQKMVYGKKAILEFLRGNK